MDDVSQVDEFIRRASRMPAFPLALMKLLKTLDQPDSSAQDIARTIESDSALVARLLRLANSSFYGRAGSIASVRHAVVVLGHKTVRSLALTVWTHTVRRSCPPGVTDSTQALLFSHGIMCAVTSAILCARVQEQLEQDAFLCGLLHDIGRVALVAEFGAEYDETIVRPCEQSDRALLDVEQQTLGFDHAELGSRLMHTWNLPLFLSTGANLHHLSTPEVASDPILAAVTLADTIATRMSLNVAPLSPRPLHEALWTQFGIQSEDDVGALSAECRERFRAFTDALP